MLRVSFVQKAVANSSLQCLGELRAKDSQTDNPLPKNKHASESGVEALNEIKDSSKAVNESRH